MLKEKKIPHRYREYTEEPLSEAELEHVFRLLGKEPVELLRRRDPAYRTLGLNGEEGRERLISLMAENPTLLQRPIGVLGEKAAVGRPPEALLDLVQGD